MKFRAVIRKFEDYDESSAPLLGVSSGVEELENFHKKRQYHSPKDSLLEPILIRTPN